MYLMKKIYIYKQKRDIPDFWTMVKFMVKKILIIKYAIIENFSTTIKNDVIKNESI